MKTLAQFALIICVCSFPLQFQSFAHHNFGSNFDANKVVTLKGNVRSVEWTNPHVYLFLDVTDANGRVDTWALEGVSVAGLNQRGWKKEMLQAGMSITVVAFLPKTNSTLSPALIRNSTLAVDRLKSARFAHADEVTFSDGKKLMFGYGTR